MYPWIWRHLPGNAAAKALASLLLIAAAVALLFLVVFPWVEPRVPFNDVTVDRSGSGTTAPEPVASSSP